MPRPDVLPPIRHPLTAEILFAEPVTLNAQSVTAFLAERQIPLGDVAWTTDGNGIRRAIRGGSGDAPELA